jgi:imidazole glycerol phosphate synthase subunit HisF
MNSQTSQLSTSKSDDETAIREHYQQMVDGWNRGSGEVLAAPYAEDGVHAGYDGTYLKGASGNRLVSLAD